MESKEEILNLTACREFLRSFSLSDTETSVEQNLQWACTHHDSLMCQWVAVEDALEMVQLLDAEMQSMEQIIEEEQAHRAGTSGCSLTNASPSNGDGGRAGEGVKEAQCSDGRTAGCLMIFA